MSPAAPSVALHATAASLPLTLALVFAGLGASLVVGVALAALARRRSVPYLLVALAVLAILARTVVGVLSLRGLLDAGSHHLAEHALDVVMVALVVAAVIVARRGAPAMEAR